jgi:hypothetical protein
MCFQESLNCFPTCIGIKYFQKILAEADKLYYLKKILEEKKRHYLTKATYHTIKEKVGKEECSDDSGPGVHNDIANFYLVST